MTGVRSVGRGLLFLWDHSLGWPVAWLEIALIRVYQLALSPVLMPSCRYHPSCSAYGMGAIRVHGSLKGTGLGAWRILRCNPWSGGGVDPVPSVGRWRPEIFTDGSSRTTDKQLDDPTGPPAPRSQR